VVFDDQMMLRVHGGLNVVADRSGSFATTGHGTGIRIRNLLLPSHISIPKVLGSRSRGRDVRAREV
jgi:hypothetical protein